MESVRNAHLELIGLVKAADVSTPAIQDFIGTMLKIVVYTKTMDAEPINIGMVQIVDATKDTSILMEPALHAHMDQFSMESNAHKDNPAINAMIHIHTTMGIHVFAYLITGF